MKRVLVEERDTRPAIAPPDRCGYCPSRLGEEHALECVCRRRSVVVRLIVEYAVTMPESWDEAMILSNRNDGCWCASNAIQELEALNRKAGCLCAPARYEFVREATDEDDELLLVNEPAPSTADSLGLPVCDVCGGRGLHFADGACLSTVLAERVRLRNEVSHLRSLSDRRAEAATKSGIEHATTTLSLSLARRLIEAFWLSQWETRNAAENTVCAFGCGNRYEDFSAHERSCGFVTAWSELAAVRAEVGCAHEPKVAL